MSLRKILLTISTLVAAIFLSVQDVFAVAPPSFPSCLNPQGETIADYDSGTHGVPGRTNEFRGSDTVFKLSSDTLMQCLCPDSGPGIQTNWWKISSLSDPDVATLKNLGWVYIPSGSPWGLEDTRYMAFNSEFNCRAGQVLGLAATGNKPLFYGLGVLAVFSLSLGLWLRRSKSKR